MDPTLEHFLDTSRRYLFAARLHDGGDLGLHEEAQEVTPMRTMDERTKHGMASRMKDVVVNPPQRAFARELLARGMTANEVWQLVMHDPAFVRVPEASHVRESKSGCGPARYRRRDWAVAFPPRHAMR